MKLDERKLVFGDCEGNDFLPKLSKMWTIQLGIGVEGEVVVFADQPNHEPIKDALAILKEAQAYVFHNGFGYDHFAINKLYPGTMDPRKMIDTLVISRLMDSTATRHSLADIGEALGYPKGDYEDFSQFTEEMVRYGRRDVEILQRAWTGNSKNGKHFNPFGKFYSDYEKACDLEFKTAYVIQKQVNHGFRFDYDKALMLETDLRQERADLEGKLQEIFPPITFERWSEKTGKRLKDGVEVFNPGSRDQIASRLIAKYGWKPTALTETKKPKVDETILDELPYPEAKEMARFMKLGKKLGMLSDGDNSWLKLAEVDPVQGHIIHGQVNTLGARTHRMSHYKPNVAQVDKDQRMRSLFMADEGWKLVGVDAEGLELRMLSHFLFPYDNGKYANFVVNGDKKLGTDVHTMNMKAAGLYLRDSAKTMILTARIA